MSLIAHLTCAKNSENWIHIEYNDNNSVDDDNDGDSNGLAIWINRADDYYCWICYHYCYDDNHNNGLSPAHCVWKWWHSFHQRNRRLFVQCNSKQHLFAWTEITCDKFQRNTFALHCFCLSMCYNFSGVAFCKLTHAHYYYYFFFHSLSVSSLPWCQANSWMSCEPLCRGVV